MYVEDQHPHPRDKRQTQFLDTLKDELHETKQMVIHLSNKKRIKDRLRQEEKLFNSKAAQSSKPQSKAHHDQNCQILHSSQKNLNRQLYPHQDSDQDDLNISTSQLNDSSPPILPSHQRHSSYPIQAQNQYFSDKNPSQEPLFSQNSLSQNPQISQNLQNPQNPQNNYNIKQLDKLMLGSHNNQNTHNIHQSIETPMKITKRGTDLDWMEKDLEYLQKTRKNLSNKLNVVQDMEKKALGEINQIKQSDRYYQICETNQAKIVEKHTELKRAQMEKEQVQMQLQQAIEEKKIEEEQIELENGLIEKKIGLQGAKFLIDNEAKPQFVDSFTDKVYFESLISEKEYKQMFSDLLAYALHTGALPKKKAAAATKKRY